MDRCLKAVGTASAVNVASATRKGWEGKGSVADLFTTWTRSRNRARLKLFFWQGQAYAGSDNSNDAWAGDVTFFAVPPGTLIASEYLGCRQGDEYVTTHDNVFAKLTGGLHTIPSTAEIFTSITRLTYITSLLGQPLK